jgi:hypothetical protein
VENENNPKRFESVFSSKVKAGKRRTYFFDVRRTKGDDFYITLTESTKKFNDDGYERHKLFLYKEDFNRFVEALNEVVNHVKTELMPDYDYDEYTRRQEEWERKRDAGELESHETHEDADDDTHADSKTDVGSGSDADAGTDADSEEGHPRKDSDDMSW